MSLSRSTALLASLLVAGVAQAAESGRVLGDRLPPVFREWQVLGLQLWQWLGIGLAIILAVMIGYLGAVLLKRLLVGVSGATRWSWDDALVGKLRGPLWVAFAGLVFAVELPFLALAGGPYALLVAADKLLAIVAGGWFLIRIVDALGDQVFGYFRRRGDDMGMAMVPVARKILKPIIVAIMVVVVLQNVGMNVGGLLAGLGIGGLAIALAAKNTLENLFGSLVISFDRPFRLGDYVKVGDLSGTVEDLGLRSTRLRTAERTLITIPNAQMADAKVENFSARDRLRLFTTLSLQLDTSPDQIRFIIDELNRYLLQRPHIDQGSFSVRFVGYGVPSLNLEVTCWMHTKDAAELAGLREAMLLDISEIVEMAGARLALPSQTVYNGEAKQADPARASQAAATVAARRQAGELTLPAIPDRLRQSLRPPAP